MEEIWRGEISEYRRGIGMIAAQSIGEPYTTNDENIPRWRDSTN